MDDIFSGRGSILVRDVSWQGDRVDIFVGRQGTITGMGADIGCEYRKEAEFCVEGRGAIVLPGLVNTHTHAAMTLLRGYADDMPLHEWLGTKIWPLEAHLTGEDVYAGTRLACLEMIRSGTTAFNDMYFFMEDAARAVDHMGLRATLAYGFIDLNDPEKRERECRATERFVSSVHSLQNHRIQAAVGPHAVYTVSPDGMRWLADFAREQDIGIHVHLSETEKEVQDALARWQKRPPAILDDCGLLTPRTVAAHCCWLDRADCALLGERGVHASHNPASNMKLAVNRAMPYPWLRESGVSVALGTDGCASNNNLDLFEEMKVAALLQKFFWNSQTLLPAAEALHMATVAGARALRCGSGRLAPGEPADLILVPRDQACNTPLHHADSNMVYACNGAAVSTVICGGRVLMLDRHVPGEQEVLADAARAAKALVQRAGGEVGVP
jgi:5-methylthioadenosine/S-adenosylhomocysteine deaminase